MEDRVSHSNCQFTNPIEVEDRSDVTTIREDTKAGLGQTMSTEDTWDIIKIIEAGQDIIPIKDVVMGITCEAIKGMGYIIIMIKER